MNDFDGTGADAEVNRGRPKIFNRVNGEAGLIHRHTGRHHGELGVTRQPLGFKLTVYIIGQIKILNLTRHLDRIIRRVI